MGYEKVEDKISFLGFRRILLIMIALLINFFFMESILLATEVPEFGVFEFKMIASGDYPNPYLKMPGDDKTPGFVVGTFYGPNCENIIIDGFWDGGKQWKIRMAPTSVGTWTFKTSSGDPDLDNRTGSFVCTESSSRGFLRVNAERTTSFSMGRRKTVLLGGCNHSGFTLRFSGCSGRKTNNR